MSTSNVQYPKKARSQHTNPLQKALQSFLNDYLSGLEVTQILSIDAKTLLDSIPKRYTLYPPLLLLPANVFSLTPAWTAFTLQLSAADLLILYRFIAEAFTSQGITHIALNSHISATSPDGTSNITRSPMGLVPLYGDFGPGRLLKTDVDPSGQPSEDDFSSAFWVHTVQNGGIFQTWAPLWTMFSRGNVSEKARILGEGTFDGLDGEDGVLGRDLSEIAVVDMYVGIGYFAFSYLKRGVGRVYGWELNGWSVEGLRRGCQRNGWGVKVLKVDHEGVVREDEGRFGDEALIELMTELST
jgi:tRNA wybutosine-synthesizing protein 2